MIQIESRVHPVRANHLDHEVLLELDPEAGVIRVAGQRAIRSDAMAMGLHGTYLVENSGLHGAPHRTPRKEGT